MFLKHTWPAILWALFVLILCGLPGKDFPDLSFLEWLSPDKIVHLFLFGIQCFLLIKGFQKQNKFIVLKKHAYIIALLITIVYGAIIEVLQGTVFIQRSGDVRDALANALGAWMGYWIYKRKLRKQTLQSNQS